MCEWLRQFDGSIEYFTGAAYFNPTCGDPPEHIADQRNDGLFIVKRLPSPRYRRASR